MGQTILPGKPPIAITLRRSARARRIALRVSGLDGRVTLSLPAGVREAEGLRFARDREAWLRQVLAERPPLREVAPGAMLPVEGRLRRIERGERLALEAERIVLPGAAEQAGSRVAALLRTLARDRLAEAVSRHAAALGIGPASEPEGSGAASHPERQECAPGLLQRLMSGRALAAEDTEDTAAQVLPKPRSASDESAGSRGVRPGPLVLRDTRGRWGSCSSDGRLMFSWRLAMAPPPVLDYVAAHEVAHLAEMNHSPAFWTVVRRLYPGYEAPRRWLRTEGAGLHLWRFGR